VNKRAQVFLFARIFHNITFTYKCDPVPCLIGITAHWPLENKLNV